MKKVVKYILAMGLMAILSGCTAGEDTLTELRSSVKGLPMVIQTYDENSSLIDQVKGESIDFSADRKFSVFAEGVEVEKSSVVNITVGGKMMMHVGSSLIAYDSALDNIFEDYAKSVDIENNDKSVPFINRMVNNSKNLFTGQELVLLIRSQNGTPLATFYGNEVRYSSTPIDKSTSFLIDGKRLIVYRCDYTIYDVGLLLQQ